MAQRSVNLADIIQKQNTRLLREGWKKRRTRTGGAERDLFKLCLITAINGSTVTKSDPLTDDWDLTHSATGVSTLRKWSGWEQYKLGALNRGAPSAEILEGVDGTIGPWIQFTKRAMIPFLSLFDQLILIHGCPPRVIEKIKNLSGGRTKIRFWFMSDRIATTLAEFTDWSNPHHVAQRATLLQGSAKAACSNGVDVDPYQLQSWPGGTCRHYNPNPPDYSPANGSGHSWVTDERSAQLQGDRANTAVSEWNSYWKILGTGQPDGFHRDNGGEAGGAGNMSWGEATNIPSVTKNAWRTGMQSCYTIWEALCGALPNDMKYLSGNVGDFSIGAQMLQCKRQFWEHPFRKGDDSSYFTTAEILAGMEYACNNDITVYVGGRRLSAASPNSIPQYETPGHSDLQAMLEFARARTKVENFYLTFFADGSSSSTTGGLYHGPTCRPI